MCFKTSYVGLSGIGKLVAATFAIAGGAHELLGSCLHSKGARADTDDARKATAPKVRTRSYSDERLFCYIRYFAGSARSRAILYELSFLSRCPIAAVFRILVLGLSDLLTNHRSVSEIGEGLLIGNHARDPLPNQQRIVLVDLRPRTACESSFGRYSLRLPVHRLTASLSANSCR